MAIFYNFLFLYSYHKLAKKGEQMRQMSPMLQARIAQQQAPNNSNQNNNIQQKQVDLMQKPDSFEYSNRQEDKGNKSKIAKIIAISAAIAAATVGIIYAVKKGKAINLSDMTPDKFKQIQADKFTGKIKGKLKNGDKVIMEYVDGVLKKSTRKGNVNFEKVFETINNEKIVKKTVNGVTTEFNITKTQQEVKVAQEKLKNILNDKNLTSEELKKQTDTIKFKSKNQKKEIENAINSKKKTEAELKAKFEAEEKAKIEAQRKQEELDRIAKAKAEEAAKDTEISEKTGQAVQQIPKHEKLKNEIDELQKQLDEYERKYPTEKTRGLAFSEIHDKKYELETRIKKAKKEYYSILAESAPERALNQVELNQKMVEYYNSGNEEGLEVLRTISESRKPERIKHAQLETDVQIPNEYLKKINYYDNCDKFTQEEQNAYNLYYSGGGGFSQYGAQKRGITGGSEYENKIYAKNAEILDGIIEKTPPLEQDCIVYRSVCGLDKDRADFVASLKPGQIVPHKTYVSTSTSLNTSYSTNKAWMGDNSMIMRIKLPKGTKGLCYKPGEFALPINTQLKINSINPEWGIVEAEYILPS